MVEALRADLAWLIANTSYTVRIPHPMPATRTGSPRTLGWRSAILFDAVDALATLAPSGRAVLTGPTVAALFEIAGPLRARDVLAAALTPPRLAA